MIYRWMADAIAALHVAYVAAVVVGLLLIWLGGLVGWKWTANRWFRSVHLLMIFGVVLRSLIWEECPLTWWERDFRMLAGQVDADGYITFEGSPVGKVLHELIHPSLPIWVFPIVYAVFGLLVVGSFWIVPVCWSPPQDYRSFSDVEPSQSADPVAARDADTGRGEHLRAR